MLISHRQADIAERLKYNSRPLEVGDTVRVNALGLKEKEDHDVYKQIYANTTATITKIEGDQAWIMFDTDNFFLNRNPKLWNLNWLERA